MNNQIKELIKQAGTDCSGKWMGMHHAEKFAELIVRECVGLCQESIDDGCVEAEEPMRKIKEHFGVES